ncbi:MAG: hypothetical protein JSS65_14945 [Armatimonadetes bacterium]|nr:hypothetical protein [Armatimonadota bacterium]
MSKILCVTYGAGHAQIIASLYPQLVARGHEVIVFALTTAAGQLARKGIPSVGYIDFIGPEDQASLELGRELARDSAEHPDVRPGETEAYLGISYSELVADHGEEAAARMYAEAGRQAFLPKRFIRRVVEQIRPDLVLTTNSPRSEQAAVEVAAEMGLPSVVVVDLMVGGDRPRLHKPGYGTKICVIAELVRRRLIELGRSPGEVVVTGNPAFDELGATSVVEAAAELRRQKGWGDEKIVLWASQPEPTDSEWGAKVAAELAALVSSQSGWRLVFRPHPNERPGCLGEVDHIETSGRDDDLSALLKAVDAVVVVSSTVGLQAALMGKLVVQVDLPVSAEPIDYPSVGAGYAARDMEHCMEVLVTHMGRHASGDMPFAPLGRAAESVVDLADSLLLQQAR